MENSETIPQLNNSYELFDNCGSYVSCMRTYLGYFGEIASMKKLENIDYVRAQKWLEENLETEILNKFKKENYRKRKGKIEWINIIYILNDNLLVDIENDGRINVLHNRESEQRAEELTQSLFRFKMRRKKTSNISLVVSGGAGLRVVDSKIGKPNLQIQRHYNDDLIPLHRNILKCLRTKNKNGLILFHGEPGTGKSTYIRYLIHCQTKRVVFMSPAIARNLESPDFISLLIDNPNSILVIEDAEDLLTSRDTNLNSGISMLLNLTDGLLGESLGIQVICTFNSQVANIDKALLRKGRLMALYEFKPLAAHKSNKLMCELNIHNIHVPKPMTLAEIYHSQEDGFEFLKTRKQKIGFMGAAN